MDRRIASFFAGICSTGSILLLVHLKIDWRFILAVFLLDLCSYGLALYERDKYHKDRYERLDSIVGKLINDKSHINKK